MGTGSMRLGRWLLAAVAIVTIGLAGCGDGNTNVADGTASDVATDIPSGAASDVADGGGGDGGGDGPSNDASSTDGPGLALRLTGELADGLLCPGGQRPCFILDGEVEPDERGLLRVVGRLVDGVVVVDAQEPVPDYERSFSDECDGKNPGGGDRQEVRVALGDYRNSIADRYAVQWVSSRNVFHLGVVGDAADVEQAIDELGLGDDVCVVGGFAKSERDLQEISMQVGQIVSEWGKDGRADGMGWSGDAFDGVVSVDMYRIDAEMAAELGAIGDGAVRALASIEVLNGSLDDLDTALSGSGSGSGSAGTAPTPDITMTCGSVTFPAIPADVDGFDPLDAEAEEALAGALSGPAGGEMSFLDEYEWSIASRSDSEMVFFGQPVDGSSIGQGDDPAYANMSFKRADDGWLVQGFGGCRLQVSALGLGPASMILDPDREPDPAAAEIPVLIMERSCASGKAPVDREIVPVVTETETTVEVIVLVAPVKGGAECPSNPFHPIVVPLSGPLGDRIVIDGTTQPGKVRAWPPSQEDLEG